MRESKPDPVRTNAVLPALRALKGAVEPGSGAGLGLALICVVLGAVLTAIAPAFMKLLLDDLYEAGGQSVGLVLLYGTCLGLARFAGEGRSFFYGRAEQGIIRALSLRTYSHVMSLPMRFHTGRATGNLVQTLENGLQGYRLLLHHSVFTLLPGLVEIAVIAGVLLWLLDGAFLAIVTACAIAYAAVFTSGAQKVLRASRDVSVARIEANAQLTDGLLNIEIVKAFNGVPAMSRRFDARLEQTRKNWGLFYLIRFRNGLMAAMVFTAGLLGVLLLASDQIGRGDMTPGDLVLVSLYMMQIVRPMELLGFAARDAGQGVAFIERLNDILAEKPETSSEGAARSLSSDGKPMAIIFENVFFSHGEGQGGLKDVTLDIPPGTKVALVGPSGSGKSTLIRLLLKFYEPDAGRILVDGRPLAEVPPDVIREQIAVISQEPGLFNDSLSFNVGFPALDVVAGEIQEVLGRVCLRHLEVRKHPAGSSPVGERGSLLSGGERQRIAIARVLMRRPRLLLADEPASALDPCTEAAVLNELEIAAAGATQIIASHRLRSVMNADMIVVMSAGRIAETGRHEELLALDGLYAAMWRVQEGGGS